MSDDAVYTQSQDPRTNGQIEAFQKVLGGIDEYQKSLPEKITFSDGAREGCSECANIVQSYITMMIKQDEKNGVEPSVTKQKRDLILDVQKNVINKGQDYLQEKLMLQGEARMLLHETTSINKLHAQVHIEEQTRKTMEKQQDDIRASQGREETPKERPKKKAPKKAPKKKTTKTRKVAETKKK